MNDVKFDIKGSFKVTTSEDGNLATEGLSAIIDPDINTVLDHATSSGSQDFTVEDVHTSKDEYLIMSAAYGRVGSILPYSGLSPTEEVVVHRYQWTPNHLEGDILQVHVSGTNFEDNTMGDLVVSKQLGSGGVVYSGIRNVSVLDGDYYFSAQAENFRSYWLEPTASGATGLTCGRTVFLAKLPHNTNADRNADVGFTFLRQGGNTDSNGYKVVAMNAFSNSSRRELLTSAGAISDASGQQLQDRGFDIFQGIIEYDSATNKGTTSEMWMMIEWEVQPSGTLINVAYQPFSGGDSYESIAETWRPFYQVFSLRDNYTETSLKPAWILSSRENDSEGDIGLDNVWLQELSTLPSTGLNVYDVIHYNQFGGGSSPIVSNYFGTGGPGTPAGWPTSAPRHPLVTADKSLTGVAGEALGGIRGSRSGGTNGSRPVTMLGFREVEAIGITHGVCRMIYNTGTTFFGGTPKMGFAFLRQDSSWNDDAYVIEFYANSSSDWRVRLRKGKIYSDVLDNLADFVGNIQATSATLHTSSTTKAWIEVRWKVEQSLTRIEILHKTVDETYISFDTSPGNVDESLIQVISFTDNSSPYSSTSLPPMHIVRGSDNYAWLIGTELRRAK